MKQIRGGLPAISAPAPSQPYRWRPLSVEHVDGIDESNGLRLVGHHERVGASAATEEANALEQVAGRDTGRREHEVLARGEILGAIDVRLVAVAHPLAAGALLV